MPEKDKNDKGKESSSDSSFSIEDDELNQQVINYEKDENMNFFNDVNSSVYQEEL